MRRDERGTYIAGRPGQAEALTSPLRLEILGQFATARSMSIAEVAERMGRPPQALYYHFRVLERAGLIRPSGARRAGRRSERLYRPVASRIGLPGRSGRGGDNRIALKSVRTAFGMAAREVQAALESGRLHPSGPERDFYVARMHFRVPRSILAAINRHLEAIEAIMSREARRPSLPADADRICSLTVALLPLRGRRAYPNRKPGAQ